MTKPVPLPSREQYQEETLSVMDDLAVLIRAAQQLRGRFPEFKKNKDLDHRAAKPDVEKIISVARNAARDLQRALFMRQSKRASEIADARRSWLKDVRSAITLAERLARQESEATDSVSNVIELMVVRSLKDMASRWDDR